MSATYKPARPRLTFAALASHAISAALLAASVYAAVCIERSEKIDPEMTTAESSPSAMF